jgi:hypothetical protein
MDERAIGRWAKYVDRVIGDAQQADAAKIAEDWSIPRPRARQKPDRDAQAP